MNDDSTVPAVTGADVRSVWNASFGNHPRFQELDQDVETCCEALAEHARRIAPTCPSNEAAIERVLTLDVLA